jgi:8-oxo-dGTP pyrophosphatase MutT (NUDIX family)
LFEHDGEANVVLTRRSVHLRSHSGEVSFPGGRLQPGELPLQAALREANEEIGIDAGAVEIIGQLTPLTTVRSPALVHCFVGCFRPPAPARLTFSFDPGEVEKVFWGSLAGLAAEGIYHEELWPALEEQGPTTYRAIPFFGLDDDVVWGATGRLLTELIGTVLADRRASRPEGRSGLSGRYPGEA